MRPFSDILAYEPNPEDELIRANFLQRGKVMILVGQTGVGKSSIVMHLVMHWAIGLPFGAFVPRKPLRCLVIQSENDRVDLKRQATGVLECYPSLKSQLSSLGANLWFETVTTPLDDPGLEQLDRRLSETKFDLVVLDPALGFLPGACRTPQDVGEFLRQKLSPLIEKHRCGLLMTHHTPKYSGSRDANVSAVHAGNGSSEWGNFPRAVTVLKDLPGTTYLELEIPKRGEALQINQDLSGRSVMYLHRTTCGKAWKVVTPEEFELGVIQERSEKLWDFIQKSKSGRTKTALNKWCEKSLGCEPEELLESLLADKLISSETGSGRNPPTIYKAITRREAYPA